jgi:hypothetical protein
MRSPRLDKRLLRAIEDALIQRETAPGDITHLPLGDYDDALAWVVNQLDRRRLAPRMRVPLKTPLEAWLDTHPKGHDQ